MEQPPEIEGSSSKRQKLNEKENEQKVLINEVGTLDMETVRPVDEVVNTPDVKDISVQEKVIIGKKANKQNISDKQRATLAKARQVLAEKRRLQKSQKPAGTPAPDILSKVQNLFEQKFSDVTARLDNLQKIIAYEAPLQTNQEVRPFTEQKHESIDNSTFLQIPSQSFSDERIKLMDFLPSKSTVQETKKVHNIAQSFKSVPFMTEDVWTRVKSDPSLNSNSKTNSTIFF